MSKAHNSSNKIFWFLPSFFMFIILFGIVISIIQIRQKNVIRTKAANQIVNCETTASDIVISSEEQKLLDQINSYRQEQGVGQLTWSDDLIRSATWMSNDMLVHNYLDHTDSLGRASDMRIGNCGYLDYRSIAENIASDTEDALYTFEGWKNSPGYNANMLNLEYNQAGIALASNSQTNSYYWTLDLGNSSNTTSTSSASLSPISQVISPTLYPTSTPVPTPTPFPGFVAKSDDTQAYVSIKIMGIGVGGNARPKHLSRYVQVEIFDLNNKLVARGNGDLTYDGRDLFRGIIHFGKVDNGKYYIKIVGVNTLVRLVKPQFQELSNTVLNILPSVTLIQGDTNVDDIIDINDYNSVLPCFQDIKCKYRKLIDFNDDGITNAIDYNILLLNFWESKGD